MTTALMHTSKFSSFVQRLTISSFIKKKAFFFEETQSKNIHTAVKTFPKINSERSLDAAILPHVHICRILLTLMSPLSSQLHCFALVAIGAATLEIVTVMPLETSQCRFYPLFGESEVEEKECPM